MSGENNNQNEEASIGLLSSADVRTGFLRKITTGEYKSVVYSAVDGQAILEGCIVLGTVDEMEKLADNVRAHPGDNNLEAHGVAITGARFRWPKAIVPFQIAPTLPNKQRVTDAIAHWQAKTKLKFPARKPTHKNFITFRPAGGCSSSVGMQGKEQFINLGDACTLGNVIHEIGHAIGLFHEQSREDRDKFVKVRFENIDPSMVHNFNQHITDGDDLGGYDYGSIMHYPRTAFSKNGKPTIEPVGAAAIGQRVGLSAGDIAAVAAMYP